MFPAVCRVQDLSGTIQKVSSYLGRPLVEDEVNSCVKHCSFSSMKVNKMVNYSLVSKEIIDHSKGSFMRKGEASHLIHRQSRLEDIDHKNVHTELMQTKLFEPYVTLIFLKLEN